MSVSLLEVIEAGGYDLSTEDDAKWLLAQVNQFEELVEKAKDMLEAIEEAENERLEQEYIKKYGSMEDE